ncbi:MULTISPECIES: AEC family transporter [unclassified Variovorax]|jgi:malonate transporter|uniref:AEC family transporter n=1 Tax=unclassified Variovorax TaxID=663243 RepID=UPI000C3B08B9|nr:MULTISPECIES: AEC family transporter [unclassified Variovorax]MBS74410.1 transporter [Variovorax sp.]MCT8180022.1 AEC family transporter [Variovorax sp. CY25R-8]
MLGAVNYAQLLFPDFSLIAIGWLLCRYTALDRKVWDQVESLVYYFLFPTLLFHSIVRSPLDFGATSSLLMAGVGVSLCGVALAYALPWVPGLGSHLDRRDHAASVQVAFRFNSFICLAMAERLAGPEGLLLIAVLIGVCVPMMNIAAVWPMTRHAQTGFARQLVRNPLIVATVAGLLANVLGFTVPGWLTPTLSRIGAASLALGLLAAGAGMQFATLGRGKVLAVSVLSIRHFILPLVAWGLARWLRLDAAQASVLMAFSAVPTASSAYVLAQRMGYNGAFVAGLVTMSTVLGVVSLPFALALPR